MVNKQIIAKAPVVAGLDDRSGIRRKDGRAVGRTQVDAAVAAAKARGDIGEAGHRERHGARAHDASAGGCGNTVLCLTRADGIDARCHFLGDGHFHGNGGDDAAVDAGLLGHHMLGAVAPALGDKAHAFVVLVGFHFLCGIFQGLVIFNEVRHLYAQHVAGLQSLQHHRGILHRVCEIGAGHLLDGVQKFHALVGAVVISGQCVVQKLLHRTSVLHNTDKLPVHADAHGFHDLV